MRHIKKFESNDFPEREKAKFFGDIEKKHKIDPSKIKQSQNRRYFITSVDENGNKYLDITIRSNDGHPFNDLKEVGAILLDSINGYNNYLIPISDSLHNEIEEFAKKYNDWYSQNRETSSLIHSYVDLLMGLRMTKYDPGFDLMDADFTKLEDKIESRLKELYKKNDECPDYIVVMKKIEKEVPMSLSHHILKP